MWWGFQHQNRVHYVPQKSLKMHSPRTCDALRVNIVLSDYTRFIKAYLKIGHAALGTC